MWSQDEKLSSNTIPRFLVILRTRHWLCGSKKTPNRQDFSVSLPLSLPPSSNLILQLLISFGLEIKTTLSILQLLSTLYPVLHQFTENFNRITSTKSPPICMKTFRANLTNITILLPQSNDRSYYVSKRILTPQPLWLQKHTDLLANGFAYSTNLWHQLRLAKVTCSWIWKLFGINTAILFTD